MLLITACTTQDRAHAPATPSSEPGGGVVSRAPAVSPTAPSATIAPSPAVPVPATAPAPPTAFALREDAIYVCVTQRADGREESVIELAPKVLALCKRHPEMGPCQYGRNQCRAAGGRVYASGGEEITLAHEAEYDRKVLRVRFRSN
jgi:hypothetical protein